MNRPGFAHVGVVALICLALVGCNQVATPAAVSTIRQQQSVNGLTVTLEMAAQPILNQPQQFVITLSDERGQFVDDADVYLELEMTKHPMGSNKPIATAQGAGVYNVQAAYTMTGPWAITVVAERTGQTHRASFTAEVKESYAQ